MSTHSSRLVKARNVLERYSGSPVNEYVDVLGGRHDAPGFLARSMSVLVYEHLPDVAVRNDAAEALTSVLLCVLRDAHGLCDDAHKHLVPPARSAESLHLSAHLSGGGARQSFWGNSPWSAATSEEREKFEALAREDKMRYTDAVARRRGGDEITALERLVRSRLGAVGARVWDQMMEESKDARGLQRLKLSSIYNMGSVPLAGLADAFCKEKVDEKTKASMTAYSVYDNPTGAYPHMLHVFEKIARWILTRAAVHTHSKRCDLITPSDLQAVLDDESKDSGDAALLRRVFAPARPFFPPGPLFRDTDDVWWDLRDKSPTPQPSPFWLWQCLFRPLPFFVRNERLSLDVTAARNLCAVLLATVRRIMDDLRAAGPSAFLAANFARNLTKVCPELAHEDKLVAHFVNLLTTFESRGRIPQVNTDGDEYSDIAEALTLFPHATWREMLRDAFLESRAPTAASWRRCAACGKQDEEGDDSVELQVCGGCLQAFYCSAEHQREHWAIHSTKCEQLADELDHILLSAAALFETMARFIVRVAYPTIGFMGRCKHAVFGNDLDAAIRRTSWARALLSRCLGDHAHFSQWPLLRDPEHRPYGLSSDNTYSGHEWPLMDLDTFVEDDGKSKHVLPLWVPLFKPAVREFASKLTTSDVHGASVITLTALKVTRHLLRDARSAADVLHAIRKHASGELAYRIVQAVLGSGRKKTKKEKKSQLLPELNHRGHYVLPADAVSLGASGLMPGFAVTPAEVMFVTGAQTQALLGVGMDVLVAVSTEIARTLKGTYVSTSRVSRLRKFLDRHDREMCALLQPVLDEFGEHGWICSKASRSAQKDPRTSDDANERKHLELFLSKPVKRKEHIQQLDMAVADVLQLVVPGTASLRRTATVEFITSSGKDRQRIADALALLPYPTLVKLCAEPSLRDRLENIVTKHVLASSMKHTEMTARRNRLSSSSLSSSAAAEVPSRRSSSEKKEKKAVLSSSVRYQLAFMPVFDEHCTRRSTFTQRSLTPAELEHLHFRHSDKDPRIAPGPNRLEPGRPSTVSTFARFMRNLHAFTGVDPVKDLCLSETNMIMGGAVLAALMPQPAHIRALHATIDGLDALLNDTFGRDVQNHIYTFLTDDDFVGPIRAEICRYFLSVECPFWLGDVDMFVMDDHKENKAEEEDEEVVAERVQRCAAYVALSVYERTMPPPRGWRTGNHNYYYARSDTAISFCGLRDNRNLQFVPAGTRTAEDVLSDFDIDCCCFATDGKQVYTLPRGARAINTHCNFFDPFVLRFFRTRKRVAKYFARGFDVLLFEVCRHAPRCDVTPSPDVESIWQRTITVIEKVGQANLDAPPRGPLDSSYEWEWCDDDRTKNAAKDAVVPAVEELDEDERAWLADDLIYRGEAVPPFAPSARVVARRFVFLDTKKTGIIHDGFSPGQRFEHGTHLRDVLDALLHADREAANNKPRIEMGDAKWNGLGWYERHALQNKAWKEHLQLLMSNAVGEDRSSSSSLSSSSGFVSLEDEPLWAQHEEDGGEKKEEEEKKREPDEDDDDNEADRKTQNTNKKKKKKKIKVGGNEERVGHACYGCGKQTRGEYVDTLCDDCQLMFREASQRHMRMRFSSTCLVTGARSPVGMDVCLRLLRAGATVLAVTRFPNLTLAEFKRAVSKLKDATKEKQAWFKRLHVYGLDLRASQAVSSFCSFVRREFGRLGALFHLASMSVRRPPAYYRHFVRAEMEAMKSGAARRDLQAALGGEMPLPPADVPRFNASPLWPAAATLRSGADDDDDDGDEALFPEVGVDLRKKTSWNTKLPDMLASELDEAMRVNVMAPTIMLRELAPAMTQNDYWSADDDDDDDELDPYARRCMVVFAFWGESPKPDVTMSRAGNHAHLAIARGAVSSLVRSQALLFQRQGVVLCGVDAGWCRDVKPFMYGNRSMLPLSVEQSASLVLDPLAQFVAARYSANFAELGLGKWAGKFMRMFKEDDEWPMF